MKARTQTRVRPELRPVWTGLGRHDGYPRASYSATSPLYSASLSLPSPIYTVSPNYDPSMRAHERALVDRLDQRGRRESLQSPTTARSLSPISEQTTTARRGSDASLPLPVAPVPSPRSPTLMPYARRQTLVAETKSILLSGMPDSPSNPPTETAVTDRRQSLPPVLAPSALPAPRRRSQMLRQELQAWGHIYFNSGSEANCFVSAVTARRPRDNSGANEDALIKDGPAESKHRVTIRALIRPCALNRKPFRLSREFDMDELRATIPEMTPVSAGPRRSFAELSDRSPLPSSHRRSSAVSTERSPDHDKSPARKQTTVPIHLTYARAFFPVLAAFLYSGHIQTRDIIELPMPHPEAWRHTVSYVYTGQGDLTESIKQNIMYLGETALMNTPLDRRPSLASSVSAPNVFCRPMDPAPEPLVCINGRPGIGKETVAECLTLLLGKDRSLLIDVRSVGRENSIGCCGGHLRAEASKRPWLWP
ncbi:hypothetical protein N0V88_006504 [Collariella sp. IMI 366227]|nr:hypothetical protein N0V88_006504 [Collariella sp. IMI 366227]